tara:strand:+ start:159 stop:1208 length:1050 start_codon:yes stop_codon:yes gene_type:complete
LISERNLENSSLIKGNSSSYQSTPSRITPSIPSFLLAVILCEILAFIFIPKASSYGLFWLFIGLTVPFLAWFLVYWRVYQSVFVTKKADPVPQLDARWAPFKFNGWGNEPLTAYMMESEEESDDLLLYLHGYNSRMFKGESRAIHLQSLGINIVSLDQRGFGDQGKRKDWTLLKVLTDIEGLLISVPEVFRFTPSRLWIYGHSMGGLLTIRLSSHPSGWWAESLRGIILESPVASFPKIIDKLLPGRAVMAKPWVRHILRREHERIHPDLSIRYANAQLPYCGIPNVPTLVIQSENDEVLGQDHFDLIRSHLLENSEIHVIDMPHSSQFDFDERREVVEKWMRSQLLEV